MSLAMTVKGYLTICRITNLPSVWTNVLCAYLLTAGEFSWQGYLVAALPLSCFYLAGICLNDVCDTTYDMVHRPCRPIPSGCVTQRGALHLAACLFAIGFLLFQRVPHVNAWYATFFLVTAIIWYDFSEKQKPFSVFLMASCRFLVFVVTSLTVAEKIPLTVLFAGGAQFAYVVWISLAARYESSKTSPFKVSVIPFMLAGICVVDGLLLALFINPALLLLGIVAAMLMLGGQKYVMAE